MLLELGAQYFWTGQFIYQLLATLTTYSIITTTLFFLRRQKRYKLLEHYGIPGPKPRLLDGHLHRYLAVKAGYMLDQSFYEQYGSYYAIFIGDEPSIILSDLELLRKVFFERMGSFKERSEVFLDTPMAHGILFARHHRWKAMRKIMSPAFSAYTMRGNSSTEFIEESIRLMLAYIEDKLSTGTSDDNNNNNNNVDESTHGGDGKQYNNNNNNNNDTAKIDMHDLMKATALHMISAMAIKLPNVEVKEEESHIKSLDSFLSSSDKGVVVFAIRFPLFKRLLSFIATHFEGDAMMKMVHQALDWHIERGLRRLKAGEEQQAGAFKNGEQPQLIDTIIKLHHEGKMTRVEVIGNVEAILFAGYDTTSTTLSYIFWALGKHPEVQTKLRQELMAHGVESKYLEQVINETMRRYPTVISFTSRLATETVTIDHLTVPQGCRVVYNSWLLHMNPKIWPNPDKFDPERFRAGANIHACAFAPFGLGDRRCLGYELARLEMKMITCDILMRYRIRSRAPEQLELVSYAVVLTKPKDKIMIELEKLQA